MNTFSYVIADDSPAFREGFVSALDGRSDLHCLASVDDAADAIDACRRLQPHFMIVDHGLSGFRGVQVAQSVWDQELDTLVIGTALDANSSIQNRFIAAGAVFLCKENLFRDLHSVLDRRRGIRSEGRTTRDSAHGL